MNNKIQGMDQTPTLNFGLRDTQQVSCEKCSSKVFQNGVIFRKVSKLVAGTDKDALVPINIPYCVNCKAPLSEIIPPEIKEEFEEIKLTF